MQLILVGSLPAETDKLIKKYFKDGPTGKKNRFAFPTLPPIDERIVHYRPAPDRLDFENPGQGSAEISLGLRGPPRTDNEACSVRMTSLILGGNSVNSRLHRSISSGEGLAYDVGCNYNGLNNTGLIEVYGVVDAQQTERALDLMFQEMRRLRDEPVAEEGLEGLRRAERYRLAKLYETNEGRLNAIKDGLDDGLTLPRVIGDINAVTPESIMRVAQKYFPRDRDDKNYVLVVRDPLMTASP